MDQSPTVHFENHCTNNYCTGHYLFSDICILFSLNFSLQKSVLCIIPLKLPRERNYEVNALYKITVTSNSVKNRFYNLFKAFELQ